MYHLSFFFSFFFFNDTAPTEIYTLSLHDALPILLPARLHGRVDLVGLALPDEVAHRWRGEDRKSTRLNSSHVKISYAFFCWKKKKARPGPAVRPGSSPRCSGKRRPGAGGRRRGDRLSFTCAGRPRDLHSFPTRGSSD